MVSYYQLLSNSCLKMADYHQSFANDLKNEIIEPLHHFTNNYEETNFTSTENAHKYLDQLVVDRSELRSKQDNYNKLSRTLQKLEVNLARTLKSMETGEADDTDLERAISKQPFIEKL